MPKSNKYRRYCKYQSQINTDITIAKANLIQMILQIPKSNKYKRHYLRQLNTYRIAITNAK